MKLKIADKPTQGVIEGHSGPVLLPSWPRVFHRALVADQSDDWGQDQVHVTDLSVAIEENGNPCSCPRALWLRLSGAEAAEQGVGKALMFDHSHRIHERLNDLLVPSLAAEGWTEVGREIAAGERLCERLGIPEGSVKGTTDLLLRDRFGHHLVVDWKSVRGKAFNYLDKPKPANTLQVQAYALAWDAVCSILVYVDREGQNGFRWFVVERDDELVRFAVDKTLEYATSAECPPVLSAKTFKGALKMPWQCDYCDFLMLSCDGAEAP